MQPVRVPPSLVAHAIWVGPGGESKVIYLTERRHRRTALWGAPLAAALLVAGLLLRQPMVFAIAAIAVLVGATVLALSGQAGYYAIGANGVLGDYLGRRPPDLTELRRVRPRKYTSSTEELS